MTYDDLKLLQGLPTVTKIHYAQEKIREWYEHWNGQVYVSFSGGKDSTVLLHLVRKLYPEVPAVFVDTGLEFPEIREFVRTIENVVWLKPKMNFKEVLEKYGYPVVSKQVSMALSRYRNTTCEHQKDLRLNGGVNQNTGKKQTTGVIPDKWKFLVGAPFKISESCCDVMKKRPVHLYEKETMRKPIIGTMAGDSRDRQGSVLKFGCNAFGTKPQSRPLSIWTEQDIWNCLNCGIPYSKIYDMGYTRTGCVFCMFGLQFDQGRFTRLEQTHPKLHDYCMNQLGMREVIDYVRSGGKK